MMRCARAVSFHRLGSSACWFSSASRALALSKSKVPPQQPNRLLDGLDHALNFRAHLSSAQLPRFTGGRLDVAIAHAGRNICLRVLLLRLPR
jgi:hypothetical protein